MTLTSLIGLVAVVAAFTVAGIAIAHGDLGEAGLFIGLGLANLWTNMDQLKALQDDLKRRTEHCQVCGKLVRRTAYWGTGICGHTCYKEEAAK